MTETAETGTALALFPKLNLPSVTGITEEMNKSFGTMYTRIEAGIAELPQDMTVKANREKVASYAYSISRTKTGLDEAAAGVSGDAKLIVDAVNAERRQLKTTLDSLRDKAREKLDAWEAAEDARKDRVKSARHYLENVHVYQDQEQATAAIVQKDYIALQEQELTAEKYGEDVEMLLELKTTALERLHRVYQSHVKAEADAAELAELRRLKAEKEEADRIAAEQKAAEEEAAAQAERDRIERERIAEDARIAAVFEAQEKIEAAEREREEAREASRRAEEARQREAEQAEANRIAAAAAAEQAAKEREEQAAEKVRQEQRAEQERIERERLAKEKADRERAADIAHRRKLNGEAAAAIMKVCGLSEKDAQNVVIAIYKEQVPHVTIAY